MKWYFKAKFDNLKYHLEMFLKLQLLIIYVYNIILYCFTTCLEWNLPHFKMWWQWWNNFIPYACSLIFGPFFATSPWPFSADDVTILYLSVRRGHETKLPTWSRRLPCHTSLYCIFVIQHGCMLSICMECIGQLLGMLDSCSVCCKKYAGWILYSVCDGALLENIDV